jgi:1-acyl-sn-glycerol-3-phosphate acyltransferase
MKFIHTSDWHLGRLFHNASLLDDQQHLLNQVFSHLQDQKADALVIAGAVRRPVRFVMDHHIFKTPVLGGIFRMARAIPIGPKAHVPDIYNTAFERIDENLKAGHVVCIFPEGRLTTDGEIAQFRSGVDIILQKRPVPVVPMALRGLWGSFFSHYGGPAMKHLPKRFWSRIELLADSPVPPEEASSRILEERVRELHGDTG